MSDTIKSITNCPTCGVECKIGNGDGNSHYYIPIEKELQSILDCIVSYKSEGNSIQDAMYFEIIQTDLTKFLNK